uniref:TIL domain-containing protein n=1 Tax=Rhabditophanes sp. KR3021 TaxID=114890 RepID=A0AC35U2L8_9BILA
MIGKIIIASLIALAIADMNTPTLKNDPVEYSGNKTYTKCGSACPPLCSNGGKERACIRMCMPPGYYCLGDYAVVNDNVDEENSLNDGGLVLNDDRRCILKSDCPAIKNQEQSLPVNQTDKNKHVNDSKMLN